MKITCLFSGYDVFINYAMSTHALMSIRSGVRTKGENPRYAVLLRVLILPRAHLLFLKPLVIGPNENHRIFIYLFFNKLLNLLSFIYTFFFPTDLWMGVLPFIC